MALDMTFEELAAEDERRRQERERYVAQQGAVPAMGPYEPAPLPVQGPPEPAPAYQPQVPTGVVSRALGVLSGTPIPATTNAPPPAAEAAAGPPMTLPGAVQRGLSVLGGVPIVQPPVNPPEQPSPRPLPPPGGNAVIDERPSAATQAIVDARTTDTEPTVEGQPGFLSALGGAIKRGAQAVSDSITVSSSTPETASTPKKSATGRDTDPLTATGTEGPPAAAKPAPYVVKGATGTPRSATGAPEAPPNATPKASIDPTFLVRLEKSNPALHDQIVQAATTAGIGSWDYANLIYAASKADPNHNENGRKGLAGLTDSDIARFKSGAYAQAFANADPMDPATNLMMGALKYREVRDEFGPKTPSSIAAYYLGIDRVNELSRHTPEQQREHLPPAAMTFVQQAIGGPDAKPGTEPQLKLTDNGTYQPRAAAQAMGAAAQAGDPRIYYRYQNDALPRGMTSNDGWRYAEGKMVTGFIRAGDMDGAQKAREMLFQMQHVGANQALMRAHGLLGAGDMVGAAKELALAYWATPDGGQAKFHITPQGIIGQRYNEATGQPVGAPFAMDQARIMGLMNVTKDPMAYQKNVREGQKLNAEIEHKAAETGKLKAETADIPLKRETAQDEITRRYVNDVLRSMKPTGAGANKDSTISAQIEKEFAEYYEIKDPLTGKISPSSPELEAQGTLFKDMRMNMPHLSSARARGIAKDLYDNPKGGAYAVKSGTGGVGWIYDRSNPNQAVAFLSPSIARLFVTAPAAPAASPPRIGATPAPPVGR